MALIEDGKPTDVFHVSTGAFGTPTGTYSFYEKSPGYNQKGMYYSVYYSGNYARTGTTPSDLPGEPRLRPQSRGLLGLHLQLDQLGDTIYVYD